MKAISLFVGTIDKNKRHKYLQLICVHYLTIINNNLKYDFVK
jgi:hypothetical protein